LRSEAWGGGKEGRPRGGRRLKGRGPMGRECCQCLSGYTREFAKRKEGEECPLGGGEKTEGRTVENSSPNTGQSAEFPQKQETEVGKHAKQNGPMIARKRRPKEAEGGEPGQGKGRGGLTRGKGQSSRGIWPTSNK